MIACSTLLGLTTAANSRLGDMDATEAQVAHCLPLPRAPWLGAPPSISRRRAFLRRQLTSFCSFWPLAAHPQAAEEVLQGVGGELPAELPGTGAGAWVKGSRQGGGKSRPLEVPCCRMCMAGRLQSACCWSLASPARLASFILWIPLGAALSAELPVGHQGCGHLPRQRGPSR